MKMVWILMNRSDSEDGRQLVIEMGSILEILVTR